MYTPQPGWILFLVKLVVAVAIMTVVLIGMMWFMPAWDSGNMLMRLLRLMAVVVVGAGYNFAALGLLGFRVRDFTRNVVV